MRTLKCFVFNIIILFNVIACIGNVYAWGDKPLLTINDKNYFKEDYKQWWSNWKDENAVFPNDLNSFIEWHLLVEEAKKMELDTLPVYRKKLETFLRVRGIFLLKNEEIDSKIKITDQDIINFFQKKYNPVWDVTLYSFPDELNANISYETIIKSGIDALNNDLKSKSDSEKSIIYNRKYSPISFKNVDSLYSNIIELKEGEYTKPFFNNGKYLIAVMNKIEERNDDFLNAHKEDLIKDLRKVKQTELTNILLEKLKVKYKVNVDRELFKNSDYVNVSNEILNRIFIQSTNGNILYSNFVNNLVKDNRIKKLTISKEIDELKEAILNGMLFDILIAWEIIDRHYEKKPPLSNLYEFYKQNRLVVEFNKEVFEKHIKTNEDDILSYYNSHMEEFVKPDKISLSMINVDQDLADKIINEIKDGKDFFEVVRKYQHTDTPIQQILMNELEPDIRKIVNNLSSGEVSEPAFINNRYVIVKLINKQLTSVIPLEQVTTLIADKLFQAKLKIVKNDYLAKLKSKSILVINDDVWNELRKEFGDRNVQKDN